MIYSACGFSNFLSLKKGKHGNQKVGAVVLPGAPGLSQPREKSICTGPRAPTASPHLALDHTSRRVGVMTSEISSRLRPWGPSCVLVSCQSGLP